jgi:hypothetical protein
MATNESQDARWRIQSDGSKQQGSRCGSARRPIGNSNPPPSHRATAGTGAAGRRARSAEGRRRRGGRWMDGCVAAHLGEPPAKPSQARVARPRAEVELELPERRLPPTRLPAMRQPAGDGAPLWGGSVAEGGLRCARGELRDGEAGPRRGARCAAQGGSATRVRGSGEPSRRRPMRSPSCSRAPATVRGLRLEKTARHRCHAGSAQGAS